MQPNPRPFVPPSVSICTSKTLTGGRGLAAEPVVLSGMDLSSGIRSNRALTRMIRMQQTYSPRLAGESAGAPGAQCSNVCAGGFTLAQGAVPVAVAEVDDQADSEPDYQSHPGLVGQEQHHGDVNNNSARGKNEQRGATEWPFEIWPP